MLINYLKIAWRNLITHKFYSAINIIGLAVALAVCMVILLYVSHESSYDRFHKQSSQIFSLQAKEFRGNDSVYISSMSYGLAPLVKSAEPAIKSFVRLKEQWVTPVIQNPFFPDRKFMEPRFIFADSNFFSFFSFPLILGSKQEVLNKPNAIVVSQAAAVKYFGNTDPVGKILRFNNKYNFIVTGIAAKIPSNSGISFEFIASLSSLASIDEEKDFISQTPRVQLGAFQTYFLLDRPENSSRLTSRVQQMSITADGDNSQRYVAIPIADIHLNPLLSRMTNAKYIKLFPFIAGLILMLALTNYISLSVARSSGRAREIGVRKVMGASRKDIASQFFLEAALHTGIAFVLALFLCAGMQARVFHYLDIDIDRSFLFNTNVVKWYVFLFVLTIVLAASYPSILLSAYKPVKILYGKFIPKSGGISVRKFITVFQFVISITIILCGIVIQEQMNFFRNTNTGINRENIVMIPFRSMAGGSYTSFRNETAALSEIEGVTASRYAMYQGRDVWPMKTREMEKPINVSAIMVDAGFVAFLGLQWAIPPVDSFYRANQHSMIINYTAIEKLRLPENPIGEEIMIHNFQREVGGVVKDFNFLSLHDKIDALCFFIVRDSSSEWGSIGGSLFARIKPHANIRSALDKIKAVYEKHDREKPFEYQFMDDAFESMYRAEDRLAKIFAAFTVFSLFIACLGLFGLATFTAEQRTKEIGIRKVLGASVAGIAGLLSRDFIKLIILAIAISSPLAWYFMNKWLQEFAYRIHISWWIFAATGLVVILIGLLSVIFQALHAAVQNPVKSLRTE